MIQNKALIFKSVPKGAPVPGKDLATETREFDLNQAPPAGGVIYKSYYASFDPYLRGRMRAPEVKSYTPPFPIGEPIVTQSVAKVLKSDNPKFAEGEWIKAYLPIQEYGVAPKDYAEKGLTKIENPYGLELFHFIGALGMPGLTAYSSFYEIGQPKKGETIFISAASGAVGQIVGQLAKHEGLTVIGSVGSDEKLDFILKELNFDSGFNYKKEKPADALKRLAPKGIDIYYENVGSEHLEAAIEALNDFGRIVACGMISGYSTPDNEKYPIRNLFKVVTKRLTIRGFIVGDANMGPRYAKEHQEKVAKWLHEGTFKAKVSFTEGIDNAAEGFLGMLEGKNFGKAVLKIADPEKTGEKTEEKL
jgi:NADPH-dependent curcumin reductase CurA